MKKKPKTIQQKIFVIFIRVIFTAITFFVLLSVAELVVLQGITGEAIDSQTALIKQESERSMMELTKKSMEDFAFQTADNTDWNFWMFRHDCVALSKQVKDILTRRSEYEKVEVTLPDPNKGGELSLQLMLPAIMAENEDDYEKIGLLANLGPAMEAMILDNELETQDFVIGLPSGISLVMDTLSDKKYDENGALIPYDPRVRPWWDQAVKTEDVCFTTDVNDKSLGESVVVFGVPVYDGDELLAVVESSINLNTIGDIATKTLVGEAGFTIIVSDDERLIYSSKTEGELVEDDTFSTFISDFNNEALNEATRNALNGETGFSEIIIDGKEYCVGYAPMTTVYWTQMIFIPKEELTASLTKLLLDLDLTTAYTVMRYQKAFRYALLFTILAFVFLILVTLWQTKRFSRKVTDPLKRMSESMHNITSDNIRFLMDDTYRTGDEIELLAENFAELTDRTVNYIEAITNITAEKERVGTELALATKIQADILPCDFPAFPERNEFDLYASMTPAKEVGGDFYDFFLIDNDHLGMVIADVSGKGIPAAMFMMHSKSTIANCLKLGKSPAKTLEDANNALCVNNGENMFVTACVAILTISTGKLVMANAGHERAVLVKPGEDAEYLKDKHGLFLAGWAGKKYKDYEWELTPGTKFFIYTDGVVEATDSAKELFGAERLLDSLNKSKGAGPEETLKTVRSDVDAFVGDAEQFDDLTMLCMEYKGNIVKKDVLTLDAKVQNLPQLLAFVDKKFAEIDCPAKTRNEIDVAMEEVFVNIASYAYGEEGGEVRIEISIEDRVATITFMDHGIPYDPLVREDPDITLPAAEREIGGLGVFLTKQNMDHVYYSFRDAQNILVAKKTIPVGNE